MSRCSTASAIGRISSDAFGRDDDAADHGARAGAGEQLHEAVLDAHHLRARVRGERQLVDRRPGRCPSSICFCDQPTVAISGCGEDVRGDVAQLGRGDRVAHRVEHRGAALHRRDRGERQEVGAVAGRVDRRHRRARDPVDPDVAGLGRAARRPPRARCPRCSGRRRRPSGSASPRPSRPSARVDDHAVAVALDRLGAATWTAPSCRCA